MPLLLKALSAALEIGIPITPLLSIIADYAIYSGMVWTVGTFQSRPIAMCSVTDAGSGGGADQCLFLVADSENRIHMLDARNGTTNHFAGDGGALGRPFSVHPNPQQLVPRLSARFGDISSVCADPTAPGSYYIADSVSFRYCGRDGLVSVICATDLVGLHSFSELVVTPDGRSLYVLTAATRPHRVSTRLMHVDLPSRKLNTAFTALNRSDGLLRNQRKIEYSSPKALCLARGHPLTFGPANYFTPAMYFVSDHQMFSCDWAGNHAPFTIKNEPSDWHPISIDSTANGCLVVGCGDLYSLYVVNPVIGVSQQLAGTWMRGSTDGDAQKEASFGSPHRIHIAGTLAYVVDSHNQSIRCLELAPSWYLPLAPPKPTNK